jgi:hypothetical protein
MAEVPEQISQFPAPPGFYKLYADGPDAGPPPPAPVSGQLNVLATPFDTVSTLASRCLLSAAAAFLVQLGHRGAGTERYLPATRNLLLPPCRRSRWFHAWRCIACTT